jgi:hypothetical protein
VQGIVIPADSARQHAIVITERCTYCSKGRSPKDIIHMTSGARMCLRCYHWHSHALDVLAGNPPRGCQECHITFEVLEKRSRDGNVRMQVHVKDGIYSVLCQRCSDGYVRKRPDLYRETPFGAENKI